MIISYYLLIVSDVPEVQACQSMGRIVASRNIHLVCQDMG